MKNFIYTFTLVVLTVFSVSGQKTDAIFYQQLDWSSDGKYMSLTAMTDYNPQTDGYKSNIYVIQADGSNLQKVTADEKKSFYSTWSKDGKHIVSSMSAENSKDSDIFTINRRGSEIVKLTRNAGRNTTPAFSSDGKQIAFISSRDSEKPQIHVMKTDGTGIKKLTNDSSTGCYNPMWSPDNKKIVYYTEKGDRKDQIWIMNADGSNQTLLTGGIGHNIFPAFSPDGKQVIFSSSNRDGGNASYVDGSYLYVMNIDGSNLKPLSNIQSFFARFSPDGKKIAFIAGKFPESAIYLANSDGSGIVKLTK